jgi:hypothetical protein
MRIPFDQGTPVPIRWALRNHPAREAGAECYREWRPPSHRGTRGFDVLLTTDANIPYQQYLEGHKIAVVLSRNKWSLVRLGLQQMVMR